MTMLVAIDESGDPGFGKGSSKNLIISFVFCKAEDSNNLREIMRTVYTTITKRRFWPMALKELKFNPNQKMLRTLGKVGSRTISNLDITRENVLSEIAKGSFKIDACITDVVKKQVYSKLRGNPDKVYNYALVHPFITEFIKHFPDESDFRVLLDKRMKNAAAASLNKYILDKEGFYGVHGTNMTLSQVDSTKEPLIWIADFLSGAKYHKEVFQVPSFYEQISKKVIREYKFWR